MGNKLPYKYFLFHVVKTTGRPYANAWVALGVLYGEYARELIRHYPMLYVERFLWPSVASLFRPMDITEERFALENEPMYRDYYGLTAERYDTLIGFSRAESGTQGDALRLLERAGP